MPPDFTLPPDFSIFDIDFGIDLTGLEPIDFRDYVSISPGGPSGGSSSAVTLSGGIENYKNSLTGGANYFDIDDVDEVDDWYDNQFNSALRGLTATPETYFNAVSGTPEYLRNFNTPATSSTVSDAFGRIANLTDTQDIASTLSEYYGYDITPAEQSFNRFGGNLQTHTSSSKEQLQEFHSLVEPILQEQVPFLQATEGLNYQDALIEAYKRDPMLQSLYYKYDVTPIRQTDDGSTYLYDPFTYGEIRTLEVKDPSISDIAKSVLPTLALSAILGPAASGIVGGLGAKGATANILSSALASAASAGIQGADLEDALTAGLLGGANTFLSPYVSSALSDVGLDLGTGLNTLGISQDDLARLGAGTITGVASGEDLDQALLSGVGSLIQQRAMDSLQGIFEPTTEIDISAQTDRYMPVGDIPETEAGAAFADQVAGFEVPTIPDFNDLSLYSDLEVPSISGPTSGTPRPPSFLPTEDFTTFGLGDSFVFRPSADTSGLLTSNRFLEQPNVVDLLEDPTQIVDPNRFDRFYPEPVFSPITPPELRVEPTIDLTPPELDIPDITFDLPEFVQPPIDIAPPPVFVQPPQPIIPTPTTGGGGGASGGLLSGGSVTNAVITGNFGGLAGGQQPAPQPTPAPQSTPAPQPTPEPSDNIFEDTVAGPSADTPLSSSIDRPSSAIDRPSSARLTEEEAQAVREQAELDQQRLERERQQQADRERAEAEAEAARRQQEQERQEQERQEQERLERERQEQERQDEIERRRLEEQKAIEAAEAAAEAQRQAEEAERKAKEQAEAQRKAEAEAEAQRKAEAEETAARLAAEKAAAAAEAAAEAQRQAQEARERAEAEARERAEQERLERERQEQERLERERQEQERLEQERQEQQRAEQERLEQQRLERERQEQADRERAAAEARERAEQERLERERQEQERLEREKAAADALRESLASAQGDLADQRETIQAQQSDIDSLNDSVSSLTSTINNLETSLQEARDAREAAIQQGNDRLAESMERYENLLEEQANESRQILENAIAAGETRVEEAVSAGQEAVNAAIEAGNAALAEAIAAGEARYGEAVAAGEALGEAQYGEGLGTGRGQGAGAGIGAGLGLGLLAGMGGGAGGTGGYTPPDFEDYQFRKTYQAPELLELAPQYEGYQAPTLQGLFRGFI